MRCLWKQLIQQKKKYKEKTRGDEVYPPLSNGTTDLVLKRKDRAIQSYIAKYGTRELSKQTRKDVIELKKLDNYDLAMTPEETKRYFELIKSVNNAIRNTKSYRSDKDMQDLDNRLTNAGYSSRLLGRHKAISPDGSTGASHERPKYDKLYKDRKERYKKNRERDKQYGKKYRKEG